MKNKFKTKNEFMINKNANNVVSSSHSKRKTKSKSKQIYIYTIHGFEINMNNNIFSSLVV
jgi:hypothetical protein